jgi:hypothetical protein
MVKKRELRRTIEIVYKVRRVLHMQMRLGGLFGITEYEWYDQFLVKNECFSHFSESTFFKAQLLTSILNEYFELK